MKSVSSNIDVQIILEKDQIIRDIALFEEIFSILCEYHIMGYHFSRVLHKESIFYNGLRVNDLSDYLNSLSEDFRELNISDLVIKEIIASVCHEYDCKYTSLRRVPQLCFYIHNKLGNCSFIENIGGELFRRTDFVKYNPEIYNVFKKYGSAIVVKFHFPYAILGDTIQESIIRQLIFYYVSKHIWKYDYKIDFDCWLEQSVPAENIVEIIEL